MTKPGTELIAEERRLDDINQFTTSWGSKHPVFTPRLKERRCIRCGTPLRWQSMNCKCKQRAQQKGGG